MTKTQWAELTGKEQWDVLVALRGPDCQRSEGIKWFSTSVLRMAMHTVMRVGGTLNPDLHLIVVPADWWGLERELNPKGSSNHGLGWSPGHFFGHVVEAAQVLKIPVIEIDNTVYVRGIAIPAPLAALEFIKYLPSTKNGEWAKVELARHLKAHFGITDKNKEQLINHADD